MKKTVLLSLLISSAASAGLPKEDFVIDAARELFKLGNAPKTERLLPDQPWICGFYSTAQGYQSGTVGVTLGGAAFQTSPQGVLSSTRYLKTDVPYVKKNNSLMSYSMRDGTAFDYNFVREYQDALIIEIANPASAPTSHLALPSVIDPKLSAIQYFYCIPDEPNPGRTKAFNHPWEK